MRIVAFIDDRTVIERILRHLGLWKWGYGCFHHERHRHRTNGSSIPAWMTPSPACHGVAKRRREYDIEPVYLSSEALAQEDGIEVANLETYVGVGFASDDPAPEVGLKQWYDTFAAW